MFFIPRLRSVAFMGLASLGLLANEGSAQQPADAGLQQRKREAALERAKAKLTHTADSPWVEKIYTVAPDLLAISIRAQDLVPSRQEPYVKQAGDELLKEDGTVLKRDGKKIAWVIGPKQDMLTTFQDISGEPLLEVLADVPASFQIASQADKNYEKPLPPTSIYRKSKPVNWVRPSGKFPMLHTVYLKLPNALQKGATYSLDLSGINVREPQQTFTYEPEKNWSEAVHVNQIGFRPDDPAKRGFLSIWLGNGGEHSYPNGLAFQVLDDATGKSVYAGKLEVAVLANQDEKMWKPGNNNGTSVYRFDFSDVTTPGKYRVSVEGIGSSYPFEIGADVWKNAFVFQMKGFYPQRSGLAVGPPYSDFEKPRDFHPADGAKIYQSTHTVLDPGNDGEELEKHSTDKIVPQAWGGYHDAGDWNPRRVSHMLGNTDLLLELIDMFPEYFAKVEWNIPKDYPLPPIFNEIMFEVDCFRRLQQPDGGVGFGIESNGDPISGEVSWNQSMPAYVYAADPKSSYIYATIAARLARVLTPYNPKIADVYKTSALKAAEWAEVEWPKIRRQPDTGKKESVPEDRNFAAIELYRLTKDKKWLTIFLQYTALKGAIPELPNQTSAIFSYATLPDAEADPELKKKAIAWIQKAADLTLDYASNNAWNIAQPNKDYPMFLFFFSVPNVVEVVRAHYLTHDVKYLTGAVQGTLFPSGANPRNGTYTTGLGPNPPRNPLKLDASNTGQKTPDGQTIYGNCDYNRWLTNSYFAWPVNIHLGRICTPTAYEWPLTEAFFDIFLYVSQDEYTVEGWGRNAYIWGYLAARPELTAAPKNP